MKTITLALLLSVSCAVEAPARSNVIQITYRQPISDGTATLLTQAIQTAQTKNPTAILLVIDSLGGEVDAAWRLVRVIQTSATPIHCVVDGNARSAAFVLLQACASRGMTPLSLVMIHQPRVRFGGEVAVFSVRDLEGYILDLKATSEQMEIFCSSRMQMPLSEFQRRIDGIDWVMASSTALKMRAVDYVSTVEAARAKL